MVIPNSPTHGLFFRLLQKAVQAGVITGAPSELGAPLLAVLPAIPVPGPAGELDEPPVPVITPGPGLVEGEPATLEEPAAPPAVPGTELPSEGSLSSMRVDVRPPHAAKNTTAAKPTQFEPDAVIAGI